MAYPDDPYDNPEDGFLLRAEPKPVEEPKESRGLLKIIFTLAVVAAAGTLGWYALVGINLPTDDHSVPLVRADLAPIKELPAKPGGMEVPNQDKLVYNRLPGADGEQATPVERLLPPPETPLPPPQPAPQAAAPAAPPSPPRETASNPPAAEPAPAAKAPVETTPSAAAKPTPIEPKKPVETAKPAPPPAAAPDLPLVTASRTNGAALYRVQLAAVRDKARAELAWKQLLDKHGALLKGHGHEVVRADLGAKGIYYRLRAGAFADLAAARAFCDRLAKAKVGCLVVKNGG